jgi:hypothetical protein
MAGSVHSVENLMELLRRGQEARRDQTPKRNTTEMNAPVSCPAIKGFSGMVLRKTEYRKL